MQCNNEQFLRHYNASNLSKIFLNICELIKSIVSDKDIYYVRVYQDNSVSILTTNTNWMNNWIHHFNKFDNTFFQEKIKKAITSISSIYGAWHYDKLDALLEFNHHYQIDQGFDIYKRKKDYVEIWAFSGKADMPMFHDFCINNISKLEEITDSCREIITKQDELFFTERVLLPINISADFQKPLLTYREVECARLIMLGNTAKEIARNLNIAPRTAEIHINNLKQKLDCSYKTQLILKCKHYNM